VIDGTELTSANVSGKVLLIDFWASWCGPCLAASPVLQALHEEYSERGLMVIGANTSERDGEGNITNSPKTARSYARKHNYTYTFTYGSDAFKDVCLVRGLPTMLIVDRDGTVRDVIVGFSQDLKNKIAEKLNPLL
jgi:thiol-disulfide isomerase/thioredoxin